MKTVDGMIGFILRGVSHETEAKGPASISIPHHNALECMHTGNPVGLHFNNDSLGSE